MLRLSPNFAHVRFQFAALGWGDMPSAVVRHLLGVDRLYAPTQNSDGNANTTKERIVIQVSSLDDTGLVSPVGGSVFP